MPTQYTSRWQIPYPQGGDAPNIPSVWQARATILDTFASLDSGTLAGRPTSSTGTPGKIGRLFITTDQSGGPRLDVDDGTGWFIAGPALVDPAPSIPGSRTLGNGSQQAMPGDTNLFSVHRTNQAGLPPASAGLDGFVYWVYDTGQLVRCNGAGPTWEVIAHSFGPWNALTLGANISSAEARVPSCRVEADKVVFKGAIQVAGGTSPTTIFTVPSIARPLDADALVPFPSSSAITSLNTSPATWLSISKTTGVATIQGGGWGWWTGNPPVSLEGLSYFLS